jgi:putative phage-type endonuclease
MKLLPIKNEPNVTEKRNLYVGGSDVATILGLNKYKTQFELAKEKVGIVKNEFKGNEYTEYGNILEPQIREYINVINETKFKPDTRIDNEKGIRSNTDGFDKENQLILEIKTHGKNPTLKVYEAQMQLYMYQFDVSYGWLALYERPDNFDAEFDPDRLKINLVKRDDEYIQKILDAIETFWIRCEYLKDNPDMTEQEYLSIGQNELAMVAKQIEKLELQLANFKEIEKQHKEMKKKLYDLMDEYDIKKWETDNIIITRKLPTTRTSVDTKRLKEECPDIFEAFTKVSKVSGSVVIKLKEAK